MGQRILPIAVQQFQYVDIALLVFGNLFVATLRHPDERRKLGVHCIELVQNGEGNGVHEIVFRLLHARKAVFHKRRERLFGKSRLFRLGLRLGNAVAAQLHMLNNGNVRQKPRRPALLRILGNRDLDSLAVRHLDMRREADRFRIVHAQCTLGKGLTPVGTDKAHEVEARPIQARKLRPRRIRNESEIQQIVRQLIKKFCGNGGFDIFLRTSSACDELAIGVA